MEDLHTQKTVAELDAKPANSIGETPVLTKHACKFCLKIFRCSLDLALHIRDQHFIDIKTCVYCVKAFLSMKDLWEHEEKHNLNDSVEFLCSNCPEMFLSLIELERHEVDNHSEGSEPGMMLQRYYSDLSAVLCCRADFLLQSITKNIKIVCICRYSSTDIRNYIEHVQKGKCSCLVCNDCYRVYSNRRCIAKHKEKRLKAKLCTPLINCYIKKCKRCFTVIVKDAFVAHKPSCRPMRCTECGAGFGSIQELGQHQLDKHNTKLLIKNCRYCFKSIIGLEMFKKHVENMHGDRYKEYKYYCNPCSKLFDHPKKLFAHFKSTHRDIKPFVCNICNKMFNLRHKFTHHLILAHDRKGLVEFTKDLHVHFNIKKSSKHFIPKPPLKLFSPEELEEFKKNGIKLTDLNTLEQSQVEPRNKNPTSSNNKSINTKVNIEDKTAEEEAVNPEDNSEEITENNEYNSSNTELIDLKSSKQSDVKTRNKNQTMTFNDKTINTKVIIGNKTVEKEAGITPDPINNSEEITENEENNHRDDVPIQNCEQKSTKDKNKLLSKLICNICMQKCDIKDNYTKHIQSHKNKTLQQCLKCSKQFETITDLQKHIEEIHAATTLAKHETTRATKKWNKFYCNTVKVLEEHQDVYKAKISILGQDHVPPAIDESISKKLVIESIKNESAQAKKKRVFEMQKVEKEDALFEKKLRKPIASEKSVKNFTPVVIKDFNGPITRANLNFGDGTETTPPDEYLQNHNDNHHQNNNNQDIQIKEKACVAGGFIINEATQKNAEVLEVATMVESNDVPKYILIPFKLNKISEAENEPVELPGAPKLVRVNPLAHLIGDSIIAKRKSYSTKPRLKNPQLHIAKALKELVNPVSPVSKHKKLRKLGPRAKSGREVNRQVREYEILDKNAEDWALVCDK